jgi:hypothetical protein
MAGAAVDDPQRHFATVICRIAKGSLALDVEVLIF